MEKIMNIIVSFCIQRKIITEVDAEWFRYGLEKRLLSIIMSIPFFIIATLLSNLYVASAFFFSFSYLRSRMSGYHAKSVMLCTIMSLFLELIFFCIIYPLLNRFASGIIMTIVILLVTSLAPYNHPNMNFTTSELHACKKSSRIRLCFLSVIFFTALACNWNWIIKGISLGCAMAALLLCIAYLLDWRNKIWKKLNRN